MHLTKIIKLLLVVLFALVPSVGEADVFGHATVHSTQLAVENVIAGGLFKYTGSEGVLDSITAYFVRVDVLGTQAHTVRTAIYIWRGVGVDATLLDTSASQSVTSATGTKWYSFATIDHEVLQTDTTYLIVAWSNVRTLDDLFMVDTISTGDTVDTKTVTFGAWPNPLASTTVNGNRVMSIYATYHVNTVDADAAADTTLCFLGNKSAESFSTTAENVIVQYLVTATADATLYSIGVNQTSGGGTSSSRTVKCAVYKESDTTLVDETVERTYTTDADATGWRNYLFPDPGATITNGTVYRVCVWASSGAWTLTVRYSTSGGNGRRTNSQTYAAWPATQDASNRNANYRMQIALYLVCPSTGTGRRRRLSQETPIIDWQLRHFVWDNLKYFARQEDAIPF